MSKSILFAVIVLAFAHTESANAQYRITPVDSWIDEPIVMRNTPGGVGTTVTACYLESSPSGVTHNTRPSVLVEAWTNNGWVPLLNVINVNWAFRLESTNSTGVFECADTDPSTIRWLSGVSDAYPFTSHESSDGVYYLCDLVANVPWEIGGFNWDHYIGKFYGPYGATAEIGTVSFVSPDIDGDGHVNVVDAGYFTSDLASGYNLRSDLNYDGVLNLVDSGFLSAAFGSQCSK